MGGGYSVEHAAALCAQLPSESRCARADDPSNEWSYVGYLLARIEYDLQCIALKGVKRAKPRMVRTPIDSARAKRMSERTKDPDEIADALGIPDDRRL